MAGFMQLQRRKEIWILLQILQIYWIIRNTGAQRITPSNSGVSPGVLTTTSAYPRQSTTESSGYWGTVTSSSGVQTTRKPNGNIQNGAHTNPSNLQTERSTTTTKRPLIPSQLQSTTSRSSILPHYTPTTRRSTSTSDFWATSTTESFWTTTRRHQYTTERYYESQRPTINFTVTDSKNNIYFPKWNAERNEAVLYGANSLREFTLEFMCNASYPIEWLSQRPFGTKEWDTDEIRHFEPGNRNKIGIILKLKKYEKLESLPNTMEFSCSDVREVGRDTLQTSIKITKGINSTLRFVVSRDFSQWPTVNGLPSKYSEPRGSNTGCSVQLKWLSQEERFSCSMEAPANITFDYLERNCYDETTCQRIYTKEDCSERGFNRWRNPKTEHKAPAEIWSTVENVPSSGIVYCQREGEVHENRSAAIPFFHSLKKFCPEDDERTRQQLYVHSQPRDSILERDFVSLCASKGDLRFNNATVPYVVYVGDNMTISCISSFYHFALATTIGFQFRNGTTKDIVPMDYKLTPERDSGFMNFTTKVCVDSDEVTGIICKNYRKNSTDFVQKGIPLRVKVPKNITVENEESNAGLTAWVYTGNSGFSLRCKARGDPQPSITWHKQGRPISIDIIEISRNGSETDSTISVLQFPSFENTEKVNELHGTYTCKAENRLLDVAEKTFVVTHPNSSTTQIVVDPSGNRISRSDNTGLILGIVVPIVVLLVVGVVGFLVWKIKRQNQELKLLSKAEVDEFIFGKPEFLHHHSSSEEVNNYAPFLPYNKGYEIARDQLEIDMTTVLGSGAYAIVLRGTVHRRGDQTRVAVKTAKPMDDVGYFKALLSELKIMGFIGSHPNIVNLIGAYTKNIQNREIFIAIEYCENGNVLSYLRDNRQKYRNYVSQDGEIMTDVVITEESFFLDALVSGKRPNKPPSATKDINEDKKHRFSFNTKTITALFHR
ncbi:Platelet-derived growth factor receptor beta [Orchesella cincta]|uniref:Platelet-derived growth factor receptor beta n=1 Tax=Orchesella cincta TaxID=48709 RepID=A0A1D2NEW5_ORCCI|nr:Platelet-derived growth factor receptor beta [Orchesella cincta]